MKNQTFALLLAAALLLGPGRADTLYTTFDDPCVLGVDPFCSTAGFYQGGAGYGIWSPVSVAMGFTPTKTATLDSIQLVLVHFLAAGLNNGSDLATVQLMSDVGGAPGATLETFVAVMPNELILSPPSPPELLAPLSINSTLHPLLTAGTPYWLVASAVDAPVASWQLSGAPPSSDPTIGPVAFLGVNPGPNWVVFTTSEQAAFAINGTAVPEPTSLTLFGWACLV